MKMSIGRMLSVTAAAMMLVAMPAYAQTAPVMPAEALPGSGASVAATSTVTGKQVKVNSMAALCQSGANLVVCGTASGAQTAAGSQSVTPASDGQAFAVRGEVAVGAASSGNPVSVGGYYSNTPTGVSPGQRTNLFTNPNGAVMIAGDLNGSATFDGTAYFIGAQDRGKGGVGGTIYPFAVANGIYSAGTGWVSQRGDTIGTYVVGKGTANLATAQVSVGTAATQIVSARSGRARLTISQSAAGPCYYGSSSSVSASTGARLKVDGASKTYTYAGALYGICPSGAVTVDVDEEY